MTDQSVTPPAYDAAVVARTEFNKTGIWLPELARHHLNAGQLVISDKTFTDCLIEGPAVLLVGNNVTFEGCNMGVSADPKSLLLRPVGSRLVGPIAFGNTKFLRCRFVLIGFTGSEDVLRTLEQDMSSTSAAMAARDAAN